MSGQLQSLAGYYSYVVVVLLMTTGLYILIAYGNLIKKLVGLSIFQSAVFILFILLAAGNNAVPPILRASASAEIVYANPLPHVLILTAIVVSVATTALGLSLVVGIGKIWGTLEEEEIDSLGDETHDDGLRKADDPA